MHSGSVEPWDSANSQKLSIDSISVWTAKCVEIHRKTMHSGVSGAVGHRELAKIELRFYLSMDSKMCGNSKENHVFGGQCSRGTAPIRKNRA